MPDYYKIKSITQPNGIIYDLYEYRSSAPGSVGKLKIIEGSGKLSFNCSSKDIYGYYSSSFECLISNDVALYEKFRDGEPWKFRLNIRDASYSYFWGTLEYQLRPANFGDTRFNFRMTFVSGFQRSPGVSISRLTLSGDTPIFVLLDVSLRGKFEPYDDKLIFAHPWRPGTWTPTTGITSFIQQTSINQDLFSESKSAGMLEAICRTFMAVFGWSWTYGTHYFGYVLLGEDGSSYDMTERDGTTNTTRTVTIPTFSQILEGFEKRDRLEYGKIAAQIQNNTPVGDFEETGSNAVYLDEYEYEIPFDPTVVASTNDDGLSYMDGTEKAASDFGYVNPDSTGTGYDLDEAHNFVMNRLFGQRRKTFKGKVKGIVDYMLPCKIQEETASGTVTHVIRVMKGTIDLEHKVTNIIESVEFET